MLTPTGADRVFKGGLFNATNYVTAFSAANTELSGNGFGRIMAVLTDWRAQGSSYVNAQAMDFDDPTGPWLAFLRWAMYDSLTAGNKLLEQPLTTPGGTAQIGASVGFNAGQIGWGLAGKFTQAGSRAGMTEGVVSGTRYLTLHDRNPGTTGAGRIDDPILVTASQWTASTLGASTRRVRNNVEFSFGIAMTDLPVAMYIALRNGNSDSAAVLWADEFDTTPPDPDVGDALTVPMNMIALTLPIAA